MTGASLNDMDILSKNPRILLTLRRKGNNNELVPENLRCKVHVIISLLQDYRSGISTANSLFVPIGIAVFKVR